MRYVILVYLFGPAIVLGAAVIIATAFGLLEATHHPATLLPIVADYPLAVLLALGFGAGLGLFHVPRQQTTILAIQIDLGRGCSPRQ